MIRTIQLMSCALSIGCIQLGGDRLDAEELRAPPNCNARVASDVVAECEITKACSKEVTRAAIACVAAEGRMERIVLR